jgi:hypothetical protein
MAMEMFGETGRRNEVYLRQLKAKSKPREEESPYATSAGCGGSVNSEG